MSAMQMPQCPGLLRFINEQYRKIFHVSGNLLSIGMTVYVCIFFLKLVEWTEEFIGNFLCLCYRAPSLSLRSFLFTECDAINMQVCLVVGTAFSFYNLRRQRKAAATRWQTSVSLGTGHTEAQGGTGRHRPGAQVPD